MRGGSVREKNITGLGSHGNEPQGFLFEGFSTMRALSKPRLCHDHDSSKVINSGGYWLSLTPTDLSLVW